MLLVIQDGVDNMSSGLKASIQEVPARQRVTIDKRLHAISRAEDAAAARSKSNKRGKNSLDTVIGLRSYFDS